MLPYVVLSDLHLHSWHAFSKPVESEVIKGAVINNRLEGLLSEIKRAATEVKAAGGRRMFVTGDVFHVRGSVAPSVLNPTLDLFSEIVKSGVDVFVLPGNHDLEGKTSCRVGSAVTALESVGVHVAHTPVLLSDCNVVMIPWMEDLEELKKTAADLFGTPAALRDAAKFLTLMIHAPIDDVITGLPNHGLTAGDIAKLGYGRVFSGHYHNHKVFPHEDIPDAVISVGALAHHNWGDVGTKAGFLLVSDAGVEWRASHLPSFVDISGDMSKEDAEMLADGNYVRLKTSSATTAQVNELREWMLKSGAHGVVIQHTKGPTKTREGAASVRAGASLEVSVGEFIAKKMLKSHEAEITRLALQCLAEAGAA